MNNSNVTSGALGGGTVHPWYRRGEALLLQSEMCASQAVDITPVYRDTRGSGKLGTMTEETGCRGSWTVDAAMDTGGTHPIDRY